MFENWKAYTHTGIPFKNVFFSHSEHSEHIDIESLKKNFSTKTKSFLHEEVRMEKLAHRESLVDEIKWWESVQVSNLHTVFIYLFMKDNFPHNFKALATLMANL